MAEIGKVTPGNPIITRVPRDRPASDEKEQEPEPQEENGKENEENNERDNEENNKRGEDGGIDFYV